jgi:hypothetical protein
VLGEVKHGEGRFSLGFEARFSVHDTQCEKLLFARAGYKIWVKARRLCLPSFAKKAGGCGNHGSSPATGTARLIPVSSRISTAQRSASSLEKRRRVPRASSIASMRSNTSSKLRLILSHGRAASRSDSFNAQAIVVEASSTKSTLPPDLPPQFLDIGERLADLPLPAMRLGDYPSNCSVMTGTDDRLAAFDVVKQAG